MSIIETLAWCGVGYFLCDFYLTRTRADLGLIVHLVQVQIKFKVERQMLEQTRSVVLVEDDELVRRYVSVRLRREGYQVHEANNGLEALEIIKHVSPDFVITDWDMPEMDGMMLCRHIRAKSFQKYVYIIMMTNNSESVDLVEGLESGADDFISKPIVPRELVARLRTGERIHRLESKLRFEMSHDPLTTILNRRAFDDILHREVTRSRRYKCRLSCVMFGLDQFKAINEQYGHLAGDFTLKMVAARFKLGLRATDYFCRYEQDQFLLLLPETDLAGAELLARRLSEKLADQKVEFDGHHINVTAGFGVADLDMDQCEEDQLIGYAETAMLKAKEAGANQIEVIGSNLEEVLIH